MKIHVLLNWYDESPTTIKRMILSLAGFADTIIALDGRYEQFPSVSTNSPHQTHIAMALAARLAHIDLYGYRSDTPWPTERDKRNHLLQIATTIGTHHTDWLLMMDADEEMVQTPTAREQVLVITNDVASYSVHTPPPASTDKATQALLKASTDTRHYPQLPRLMRLDPTLHIAPPTHWQYMKTVGDTVVSAQTDAHSTEAFHIIHHTTARSTQRMENKATYVQARNASGEM